MILDDIKSGISLLNRGINTALSQIRQMQSDLLDTTSLIINSDPLRTDFDNSQILDFTQNLYRSSDFYSTIPLATGWTFSRTDTSGTATAFRADGTVATFASGVPRITNRGLLVEESRTNLLLQSQDFDNAYWTKARCTITTNTTLAPDGTMSADSLVEDTTNNSHPVFRSVGGLANATTYTFSVFVSPIGRTSCNLAASNTAFGPPGNATFSLLGSGSVTSSTGCTATIQAVAGGFYRCSITLTTVAAGNGDVYLQPVNVTPSYLGNGLPAIAIWQADLQAGSFPTSPIITTTAAGTRGADVAALSGLILPAAYTLSVDGVVPPNTAGYPRAIALDSDNNNIFIFGAAEGRGGFYMGAGAVNAVSGPSQTPGQDIRFAFRAETNNARNCINGTLGSLATTFSPKTGSVTLNIGQSPGGGGVWNSYIRRIRIIPRAVSDAELQALTRL